MTTTTTDLLDALRGAVSVDRVLLPRIYEAIGDDDPALRREALRLLQRVEQTDELLAVLEMALCDVESLPRRCAAMQALANAGERALPLLTRLSGDPRASVRRLVVDVLALAKLLHAPAILAQLARDPQSAVRAAALEALSRSGAARAPAILLAALDDVDAHPTVLLAALLGLHHIGVVPAASQLKPHLDNPMTAPGALRLLGQAGEVQTLLTSLVTSTGSRQKAAVLGLNDALALRPPPLSLSEPAVLSVLRRLVLDADVKVACAALLCCAHAGVVDVLAHAAARDDRAHLASVAHRAVTILAPLTSNLASRLRMLAADDAPGAGLLGELADAVERSRGLAVPSRHAVAPLDEATFARLAAFLEAKAGLLFSADARTRVEARLLPRAEHCRCADMAQYLDVISADTHEGALELARALELVTVHETYFYREAGQLNSFAAEIAPGLSRRPLMVWSAGCSTGEEAYTLSMVLHEAAIHDHEVIGTDLAPGAISFAREARYAPRSFRGEIAADVRKRWFEYNGDRIRIADALRPTVRFLQLNLLDEAATAALPQFDVIFCRNVLIYLTLRARRLVLNMFFQKLSRSGALLLGHSESLLNTDTPFVVRATNKGIGYFKP